MMQNVIKHVKNLYDQELYTNVIRVCEITLTVCDQKPDTNSLVFKLQLLMYHGDSLYKTQQYSQAEDVFRKALFIKQNLKIKTSKPSNTKIQTENHDTVSDVDIRYKIHLCCLALKQIKKACEVLQEINVRQRTPRISMALGNLYRESGMDRSAVTCFKDVLRECPLALDAVESLLKLGITGAEVNSFMVEVTSEVTWLNTWLKAQAQLHSRDFSNAMQTYKSMDVHGFLRDNPALLVNMGYCYHYMYDNNKAISTLQRAFSVDPRFNSGKDLLSTLLVQSGKPEHLRLLESYTPTTDMSLWTWEQWVILGNYMYSIKKYEKAAYFAQQACVLNRKSVEALLLKANIFYQLKKYHDAGTHCTEAINVCPYRYDVYKVLVESFIQLNRLREAESIAHNALKQLNNSPQALCLLVTVLLKDQVPSTKSIRKYLEKAVSLDKNYSTNAISMLVEYLEQEQQYEQASALLLKHIEHNPTSRLHQLLGDTFINLQKDDDAFHHYTTALKLDPTNQRATEGLNSIGRSLSLSKRDSYYSCPDGSFNISTVSTGSGQDADPESDPDPWPPGENISNFD